jgi:serine/threonine protein kinase
MAVRLYEPGQVLAGTVYQVVRHLATGGMGTVYEVEDTSVGKRYVLKTLHPDLFGRKDVARRMEAEARTLGRLQHPNIVEVVTAGSTKDELNLPYYVMEKLNGQNLRVVLEKKGALEATHAYRVAIDLLDALEHAHEHKIVHRDVKPENVFLHRNLSGTTTTKLLDFGIQRLLDDAKRYTAGRFVGTLRYAAPEQVNGEELGPATDIYAAGLVLYELLAGHGPFDEIGDATKIAAAHVHKAPPDILLFARIEPAAAELIMSALAKDPRDRPRDAFTFAGELRKVLRDAEGIPQVATAVNPLTLAERGSPGAMPVGVTTEMTPGSATRPDLQRTGEFGSGAPTTPSPEYADTHAAAHRVDRQATTRGATPAARGGGHDTEDLRPSSSRRGALAPATERMVATTGATSQELSALSAAPPRKLGVFFVVASLTAAVGMAGLSLWLVSDRAQPAHMAPAAAPSAAPASAQAGAGGPMGATTALPAAPKSSAEGAVSVSGASSTRIEPSASSRPALSSNNAKVGAGAAAPLPKPTASASKANKPAAAKDPAALPFD